jgi:hypothetical protein
MKSIILALAVIAAPAAAEFVVDQATFPPAAASQPVVAVALDHPYTGVAFQREIDGQREIAVQLVPTNPYTDEIWPDLVTFGPGEHHRLCWSRAGFSLVFARDGTVYHYRGDHVGNWELADPHTYTPGGEIVGLDLWGVPTDAAGGDVMLTIDEDVAPGYDLQVAVHHVWISDYSGWGTPQTIVADLPQLPFSQVSWNLGPAGPFGRVYYLAGLIGQYDLYKVDYTEDCWQPPVAIPGDGQSAPTPFGGPFDVARMGHVEGILGLGPQPTCPCGSVHLQVHDQDGWHPSEHVTVPYEYYDWPFSPRVDIGFDMELHAFWYQLASAPDMQPHRDHLEYWTWDDGAWTDRGAFLADELTGVGEQVDVGVVPDGSATVLVWSRTDTIAGEPQPELIMIAREGIVSAAPPPALAAAGLRAWPNPFNPRVNLAVDLERPQTVRLDVYDARGRRVRQIFAGSLPAGEQVLSWDGRRDDGGRAASGIYFARLTAGGDEVVHKLVLAE